MSSAKSNGADGGVVPISKELVLQELPQAVRTVARVLALLRKAVEGLVEFQGAVQEAVAKAAEEAREGAGAAVAAAEVVRGVIQEALLKATQEALLGGSGGDSNGLQR